MKKILLLSILSISLFSLLGCNDEKHNTIQQKVEKSSIDTTVADTSSKEASKEAQTKSGTDTPTP